MAAEPVSRSTGKAPVAPASATKQDELQEEIRRLRDVAAPIAPVEKEGPTIADRITATARRSSGRPKPTAGSRATSKMSPSRRG